MDWKEEIGNYFGSNNIYRTEFSNKILAEILKEWISYLNKFQGVTASIDLTPEYDNGEALPVLSGIIQIRTKYTEYFPFKFKICYKTREDEGLFINLKYSIGVDIKIAIDNIKDAHIYELEQLFEPEIFEKEYVLQLLNLRLMGWIDKMKRNNQ